LTKDYFVSSFISRLGEELRSTVKITRPRTVQETVESTLLQELNVEALIKKQRNQSKGNDLGSSL